MPLFYRTPGKILPTVAFPLLQRVETAFLLPVERSLLRINPDFSSCFKFCTPADNVVIPRAFMPVGIRSLQIGITDCHDQCAHWSRNDRGETKVLNKLGFEDGSTVYTPTDAGLSNPITIHPMQKPLRNSGGVCMGWVMGFEPTNTGTTIRCLRPLGDTHHIKLNWHARRDSFNQGSARSSPRRQRSSALHLNGSSLSQYTK